MPSTIDLPAESITIASLIYREHSQKKFLVETLVIIAYPA
jgi:hypothetical protein